MMTRHATITSGHIYFNGVSSRGNVDDYKSMYGYCPQNNPLPLFMTAYETIKYTALLRGTKSSKLNSDINALLNRTNLTKSANVRSEFLSGGTKRKLSLAIALQSNPSILILDEPSTGVDPTSRHQIWASIQEFQKKSKTVLLTSHRFGINCSIYTLSVLPVLYFPLSHFTLTFLIRGMA